MTDITIEQRVAAGLDALDRELPGWLDAVDLSLLSMSNGCRCILGQTFGDYFDAPIGHGSDHPERHRADLGFQSYVAAAAIEEGRSVSCYPGQVTARDAEYAELAAEWRRVVSERLARPQAVSDAR